MNWMCCINGNVKTNTQLRDEVFFQLSRIPEGKHVLVTDFHDQRTFGSAKQDVLLDLPDYLRDKQSFALLVNDIGGTDRAIMNMYQKDCVSVTVAHTTTDPSTQFANEMTLWHEANKATTEAELSKALSIVPGAFIVRKGMLFGFQRFQHCGFFYSRNEHGLHFLSDDQPAVERVAKKVYLNNEPTLIRTDTWEAITVRQ
jgi:hypothetical protein